jgi:hypothetical protein
MRTFGLLILAGGILGSSALQAAVCTPGPGIWNEGDLGQTDAGGLPANANETNGTGALNDICGNVSDATNGADMYQIMIVGSTFTAITTGPATGEISDPALYLFNLSGDGVFAANNGSSPTTQASLSVTGLTPGLYYLDIVPNGQQPEHGGTPIFGTSPTPLINTKVNGYSGTGTGGGKYIIGLTDAQFANTPEPATFGLIGCGLVLIGLARRRRP